MPLPSLFVSGEAPRAWSVARAAAYGAALGAGAGLLKTLGFSHQAVAVSVPEIAAAVFGFAVLCAGAAALRNVVARRLIWPDLR
jgi:hypothetical protein